MKNLISIIIIYKCFIGLFGFRVRGKKIDLWKNELLGSIMVRKIVELGLVGGV